MLVYSDVVSLNVGVYSDVVSLNVGVYSDVVSLNVGVVGFEGLYVSQCVGITRNSYNLLQWILDGEKTTKHLLLIAL